MNPRRNKELKDHGSHNSWLRARPYYLREDTIGRTRPNTGSGIHVVILAGMTGNGTCVAKEQVLAARKTPGDDIAGNGTCIATEACMTGNGTCVAAQEGTTGNGICLAMGEALVEFTN